MGLYTRLVAQYRNDYDLDFAKVLAAPVTNEVFSDASDNEHGRAFLEQHRELIDRQLRELSRDGNTCRVLTQMLRARAMIPFARGGTPETWIDPLEKLQRY